MKKEDGDGVKKEGRKENMNKEEGTNWKMNKGKKEISKDGPQCHSIWK